MRVACYARVSTQEQAEHGYSIGEQIDRMRNYCEAMGWDVMQVYSDAGFSGASTNRPALNQMIKDLVSNKMDRVLVYKLDRLSRSQKDTLFLIEDVFLKNGCDFVSMSENFDTSTPFGKAMIGILAVFAQLEREQIRERMAMGRYARAKNGLYTGSRRLPIGYVYVNGNLQKDPFEALQIKRVFEEYASGKPPCAIARDLNAEGLTHKEGIWHTNTVSRIIRKKTYI